MLSFTAAQPATFKTSAASPPRLPRLPRHHNHHHLFSFRQKNLPPATRFRHPPTTTRIRAIDAAQPFDYESRLSDQFQQSNKLKIAIIGFGNFGQFLAKAFLRHGHAVLATSRKDYTAVADSMGVSFYSDPNDLCEQHPDIILVSSAILYFEKVLESLPIQRLRRNTLFVDVLSVKEFPKKVFLRDLPHHFDILCIHPMFGPESGKHSWKDLPLVFDKVRIGAQESRQNRVLNFLKIFENEGCRMVEMSCAEHDKSAAESQFITHTVGRILQKLQLDTTPINTKGYETLLNLVENTSSDSFDLYYGLFLYNTSAMEQLDRLDMAFQSLKKELFGHLHEELRKQMFDEEHEEPRKPEFLMLPKNGNALPAPAPDVRENSNN